jgi:regulator of protease activity HflC (stomatin/prohibitin superfamily)
MGAAVIIVLIILLAIILLGNVRIVPQAEVYVIERLGTYSATWETGLHVKVPIIDRISKKVSIKEQVADFPPQPVITKDNVTMQIDTVIFFQVTDAKLYTYGVERPLSAIENLTATTLRNIIGDMELDNTLTSRDVINSRITSILDTATDKWGIKVNRVELKNILPPREIQDAMERQMKAERQRREAILTAEGEKRSQILVAEGQKESQILVAEAEKQAAILRAEADKEARIRRAQGESEAIVMVQKATADGIRMLNEAAPSKQVLALESFKSFERAADGKATKIIVPSEIQSLAGLAGSLKGIMSEKD